MRLAGWGNFPVADCKLSGASCEADVVAALDREGTLIARGNGRSYGDAALNPEHTLSLRGLDRLLAFDPATGRVTCEAGVLLADLLEIFVQQGWFPRVTPGTKFVSVGGMVAADVHGKNHHRDGSFGAWVDWMDVLLGAGNVVRCSRCENAELFQATLGGMGLTGIILRVAFRLHRIETAYIRQKTVIAEDLDASIEAFDKYWDWTYSVAWIDCLASGRKLGRSVHFLGEHARLDELPSHCQSAPLEIETRRTRSVPACFPSGVLNRWSGVAFNSLYYRRAVRRASDQIVDYDTFFYPLDALVGWNRIYGRNGFVQYQCVFPKPVGREALRTVLERVTQARTGAFLTVLKLFGAQDGMLSFPLEGYTLALDFPMTPHTLGLLTELDEILTRYEGRLYLAKDSRMSPSTFCAGYPKIPEFRKLRAHIGADRRFQSLLAQRLGL